MNRTLRRSPFSFLTLAGLTAFASVSFLAGCESAVYTPRAMSDETARAVNVLPGNARYVGMIDFAEMATNEATSPFTHGPLALRQLSAEPAARVDDFLRTTGFDPEADLERAYIAVGSEDHPETAVILAYADFDRERLISFFRDRAPGDLREDTYRDVLVFSTTKDDHDVVVALPSGSLVIASGSWDSAHQAIDRLLDGGDSLADNDSVMSLVRQVAHLSSWVVATGIDQLDAEAQIESEMDFAEALSDLAFGVEVTPGGMAGSTYLRPRAGVSVPDLEALIKGAVAAMKSAPAGKEAPEVRRLLEQVKVDVAGDFVTVDFELDNALLSRVSGDM